MGIFALLLDMDEQLPINTKSERHTLGMTKKVIGINPGKEENTS